MALPLATVFFGRPARGIIFILACARKSARTPTFRLQLSANTHSPWLCALVTARAARSLMAAVFLFLTACASQSKTAATAQSAEAQSASEYDIARDLWLMRGQPRAALEHALRAVELDDENPDAHHLAALLFLDFCRLDARQCQLEQAEHHARRAVDSKPDFREAKNTLGVALIHRKKYTEAIAVLKPLSDDILYQTPENAWGNLGWAYLELGKLNAAVDALSRSVAVQPNFCVGHFRLGQAYERQQDDAGAIKAYTDALSVDNARCKSLQDAYFARGRVLTRLGQTEPALEDLHYCVSLDAATPTGQSCQALLNDLK